MAEQQGESICVLRITKLAADGTPQAGSATGAWVTCKVQQADFTIEYENGEETIERDGCGRLAYYRRYDDTPKNVSIANLTVLTMDPRLMEMALSGDASIIGSIPGVGWAINSYGCSGRTRNGVAIEIWSENRNCNVQAAAPYLRHVIPRAYLKWSPSSMQRGLHKYTFSGYGTPNALFGDGPFNDLPIAGNTSFLYAVFEDTAVPTCPSPAAYTTTPAGTS